MGTVTAWRSRIVGHGEEAPEQLLANPRNWRIHPKAQQDALSGALDQVGWVQQVIVNQRSGHLVDGHLRVELAISRGEPSIPVVYVDLSEEEEGLVLASLDPLAAMAGRDDEKLRQLLAEVTFDSQALEEALAGLAASGERIEGPSLVDAFGVPPFSVLDTRQGYWIERRRQWLALGIRSELGRGDGLMRYSRTVRAACRPAGTSRRAADQRSNVTGASPMPAYADFGMEYASPGTSIFDPVLCEVAYRWFCPPGGLVLDPFAGGSVRGVVASALGRSYVGIDLSPEQVAANREQAQQIGSDGAAWIVGDSARVLAEGDPGLPEAADFIWTCPPYGDLERYSDDPADLSAMTHEDFRAALGSIIGLACARLRDDRFAGIVLSDIRDGRGDYRGLVADAIGAFRRAGLTLYNEAILLNTPGSMPMRVGRQFRASRKLGRLHQEVLVFLKGDAKRATEAVGPVEMRPILDSVEAEVIPDGEEAA